MLGTYFGSDPSNDDPLADRIEAVKADADPAAIAALRDEIADVLRHHDDDLERLFEAEFRTYYWPGGDGLSGRDWLAEIGTLLAAPPDTSRDHRSGLFTS